MNGSRRQSQLTLSEPIVYGKTRNWINTIYFKLATNSLIPGLQVLAKKTEPLFLTCGSRTGAAPHVSINSMSDLAGRRFAHQLNNFIDQVIFSGLLGSHEIIAVGILFDFFERDACVLDHDIPLTNLFQCLFNATCEKHDRYSQCKVCQQCTLYLLIYLVWICLYACYQAGTVCFGPITTWTMTLKLTYCYLSPTIIDLMRILLDLHFEYL